MSRTTIAGAIELDLQLPGHAKGHESPTGGILRVKAIGRDQVPVRGPEVDVVGLPSAALEVAVGEVDADGGGGGRISEGSSGAVGNHRKGAPWV
jgi:hypothetical protein